MELMSECPFCAEQIKSEAIICKHCNSSITGLTKDAKKGKFVRIKLKAREKIYYGDLYIPAHFDRVSDVINDKRTFVSLSETKEETKASEINIGYLAVNKNVVEWVRLLGEEEKSEESKEFSQSVYDD